MFLQLGIAGAMLLVFYRLGMRWMANQRDGEAERTRVLQTSEVERTKVIQDGFRADIEAHQAITATMTTLANQFHHIEGKLDTILDLTPVREQYPLLEPKVVIDPALERTTPGRGVRAKTSPEGR